MLNLGELVLRSIQLTVGSLLAGVHCTTTLKNQIHHIGPIRSVSREIFIVAEQSTYHWIQYLLVSISMWTILYFTILFLPKKWPFGNVCGNQRILGNLSLEIFLSSRNHVTDIWSQLTVDSKVVTINSGRQRKEIMYTITFSRAAYECCQRYHP